MPIDRRLYRRGVMLHGGTHLAEFVGGVTPAPVEALYQAPDAKTPSIRPGAMLTKAQPAEPVRYGQPQAGLAATIASYDSIIERVLKVRDALRAAKAK